jgi:hypothetical protein
MCDHLFFAKNYACRNREEFFERPYGKAGRFASRYGILDYKPRTNYKNEEWCVEAARLKVGRRFGFGSEGQVHLGDIHKKKGVYKRLLDLLVAILFQFF